MVKDIDTIEPTRKKTSIKKDSFAEKVLKTIALIRILLLNIFFYISLDILTSKKIRIHGSDNADHKSPFGSYVLFFCS